MDTSEKYIKMCDCPEIQDGWTPSKADTVKGDFVGFVKNADTVKAVNSYYHSVSLSRFSGDMDTFGKYAWYRKDELIWLPRQDQLQGMLPKRTTWFENHFRLYEWASHNDPDQWSTGWTEADSPEQLWLSFIMQKLYQKRWEGDQW